MTDPSLGSREQIAWVEEQGGYKNLGTYTMADDGAIVGYDAKVTPNFDRSFMEILNSGADSPEVKSMVLGHKKLLFTLEFTPYDWTFLKYCTHINVTNVDQTTYYEHAWTIGNAIKSFRLEWANRMSTNQVLTLTGCTIKKATLKFGKGTGSDGFVKVIAECIASDYSLGTSVTSLSAPTDDPLLFFNTKFTFNGSEVVEVNSGSIMFDNGINEDDSMYCNDTYSDTIAEPIPTVKRYAATVDINLKDTDYFNAWDNGVSIPGTTSIKFTKGTRDWALFVLNNPKVGVAPLPTTNTEGSNKITVAMVPSAGSGASMTITGEDGNQY